MMVLWTCAPCHDIKISILFASFAFARNSWYCSTIPLTGPMAFKKNDFFDLAEKTFALKRGTSHPSIALV